MRASNCPAYATSSSALEILKEEGIDVVRLAARRPQQQDAWGDPAGDNKVEYRSPEGRSVVLKLKTAPDVANGILDQYELGPYNLIILGEPSRWRGEFMAFFDSGIVQTVTTMAPCSVLVARKASTSRASSSAPMAPRAPCRRCAAPPCWRM